MRNYEPVLYRYTTLINFGGNRTGAVWKGEPMVSLKLPVCVSGVPPGSELKHIGGEQPGAGKLVPVNSLPFVAAECDLAKQRARAGNFK